MNGESFKAIERSDAKKVSEVATWLAERGYKPVSEITRMPHTGLFTQVMHLEPSYKTSGQHYH